MMDLLDVIRRQIERGEYQKARRVLISLVKQRPDSIPAWTLLAGLESDPVQQASCYRRILDLDPANAQSAAALQRLTETSHQPEAPLRCPQCGGKLVVHLVGDLKAKRATCQHCSTEMDLPDAYQRVEHQHEQERHATQSRTVDRTVIETRSDSWPGLLKWFQGGSRVTVRGDDTTSQQDESSLLLSPEELIEAAGGPLPPEERRKCPECGTTVPKQAPRCGWCGMSFFEP